MPIDEYQHGYPANLYQHGYPTDFSQYQIYLQPTADLSLKYQIISYE